MMLNNARVYHRLLNIFIYLFLSGYYIYVYVIVFFKIQKDAISAIIEIIPYFCFIFKILGVFEKKCFSELYRQNW